MEMLHKELFIMDHKKGLVTKWAWSLKGVIFKGHG